MTRRRNPQIVLSLTDDLRERIEAEHARAMRELRVTELPMAVTLRRLLKAGLGDHERAKPKPRDVPDVCACAWSGGRLVRPCFKHAMKGTT